jgi:hypothetical protein
MTEEIMIVYIIPITAGLITTLVAFWPDISKKSH